MKKMIVLFIILVIFLTAILSLTPISSKGNYVKIRGLQEYTHSHTKAICNSENFCQDYEVFCKDKSIVKMSPITGAAVQFPVAWEDPRDEEMRKRFC